MLPKTADVVVIGGGVVGSATTYFLAKAGLKAVLLEKGNRMGQASSANAAWVWTITRRPGLDIRLAMHSLEIHKDLTAELEVDFEYRQHGGLLVINDEKQVPFVKAHFDARQQDGFGMQMVDAHEIRELEPRLSSVVLGGLFSPIDGCTNPILLTHALNHQAEKLGARIFGNTPAVAISVENDRVTAVQTEKGAIQTPTVVNAAGGWASQVGAMVGLKIPIIPYQMTMIVTEPLPPTLTRVIMGASYMIGEYEKEAAAAAAEPTFGLGLIASQQVSGNLLLGGTVKECGFDRRTAPEEIEAIARENMIFLPSLAEVNVIRSFSNFFPFTTDDMPILGKVEAVEGFIMAAGHNGHGICLGPGSGKLMQELICDGQTSLDLSKVALPRFEDRSRP